MKTFPPITLFTSCLLFLLATAAPNPEPSNFQDASTITTTTTVPMATNVRSWNPNAEIKLSVSASAGIVTLIINMGSIKLAPQFFDSTLNGLEDALESVQYSSDTQDLSAVAPLQNFCQKPMLSPQDAAAFHAQNIDCLYSHVTSANAPNAAFTAADLNKVVAVFLGLPGEPLVASWTVSLSNSPGGTQLATGCLSYNPTGC